MRNFTEKEFKAIRRDLIKTVALLPPNNEDERVQDCKQAALRLCIIFGVVPAGEKGEE